MKTPSPVPKLRQAPHERLKAWHACYDLTMAVFRASITWPVDHFDDAELEEDFGGPDGECMGQDCRRSAQSATVALMNGARESDAREFWRFSEEACGSLARLSSELMLARDMGLISLRTYGELEALRDHAARLTWGLRVSLKRKVTTLQTKERREQKEESNVESSPAP
jgi:23S rRNA-intervening sequence protein